MRTAKTLISDWADAQADLSLRWAHTHFVGFCHVVAHLLTTRKSHILLTINGLLSFVLKSIVYLRMFLEKADFFFFFLNEITDKSVVESLA